jgi:hypothetical protein
MVTPRPRQDNDAGKRKSNPKTEGDKIVVNASPERVAAAVASQLEQLYEPDVQQAALAPTTLKQLH